MAMLAVGAAPATAAGPAVLKLEVTPIDPATGATISSTAWGQHNNRLSYRIAYSCSEAECTDAVVTLPPFGLDPTYNTFGMYSYSTWTPPAGGGATINSTAAGVTVNLGDVAAGTSSTFVVQYARAIDASAPNVVPAAYFPNGYQIQRFATISSPNAQADVTATAAPVTWQQSVPAPSIVKGAPASVRPDTDTTYTIAMSDGCMTNLFNNRYIGDGRFTCAEDYTVVDQLPAQAVFVSASGGGVYDAATRTVTWSESGAGAAGGWGAARLSGWPTGFGYGPRTVTVRYPASAFPEAADGADFIVPVTNNASVSVTYLDDAATVKTANTSATHDVARVSPFGRATQTKASTYDEIVRNQRFVDVPPDVTGLTCPPGGRDEWNRACTPGQPVASFGTDTTNYWIVDTGNGGNVPGVATVVDDDLANGPVRVHTVTTSTAATIAWTVTNGTTTTSGTTTGNTYTAPAGSWLTSARVTSGPIAGPNLLQTGNAWNTFRVAYWYNVAVGSPLVTWTNTATGTMTYPDNPEITPITVNSSGAVTFRAMPKVAVAAPAFGATIAGADVQGGGDVVPGGRVTYTVRGATANIPADRTVSPQYVFLAPIGWDIVPNSAAFAEGTVPPGVTFTYKTVTINGATHQVVIASWPSGATFGKNANWPNMTVVATPTFAVPAGTNSAAYFWAGDSRNEYGPNNTTWNGRFVDAPDADGDGNVTEAFATTSRNVPVMGTARLDVIKEICVENADGLCEWVANPAIVVGVAPDSTDITYRVTLRNGGNEVLTGVVGYDVLPWVGDSRGSSFAETLNTVTTASGNLTLQYSTSSNPCRAEVEPTNPGCDDTWTSTAAGAKSVRAVVNGSLAPGATSAFVFSANVVPGAASDAVACNSVAVDSASTLPSEPLPVCATTQEADLRITVPDRLPLQADRPGTVPFTVTNLGGSQAAPASVTIRVPAGIRITSLTPAGWLCEASATAADGSVNGPATLTCDAVDANGAARSLALNVPNPLDLPAVIPDDTLVGDDACFPAHVAGLMSDPVLTNNDASACLAVVAGDALLGVTKDDGRTRVGIGDEITYTLNVANLLAAEALGAITITDELPDDVVFISASAGGTVSGQGDPTPDGALPGGTVTWTLPSLAPAGVATPGGSTATGGAGSTASVTVTVRVLQRAEVLDEIVNEAAVSAADPASPDEALTDTDGDTDELVRTAALTLTKSADVATFDAAGDDIAYTFRVTNTGNVTLTAISIAEADFTGSGDLSDVTCPTAPLAPGASADCTAGYEVTQADVDRGTVSNTASASATPPAGVTAPTSEQSTFVATASQRSALTLVKSATPTVADAAGDEITYSFLVTNAGNVTVDDVEITETAFDGAPANLSAIVCPTVPLAPAASVTCEATYEVTQADADRGSISNTATATADAPGAVTDPVSDPSTAIVDVPAGAALTLEKSVSSGTIDAAGQVVTYLFEVTNTGNVTVSDIGIDEVAFTGRGGAVAIECPAATLAPGADMTCVGTYRVAQADVDAGGFDNTATVEGTAPNGAPVVSEESSAEVAIAAEPQLTLVKSASPGTLVVDDEVTYSFVVTNAGNVTVTGVTIDETAFTGSGTVSAVVCDAAAGSLAPDAQTVCSATYTITQDDVDRSTVDNSAVATGAFGATTVTSNVSSVRLPFEQEPAITVVKTADVDGYAALNDPITYQFRVTNTGNVTMSAVEIVEEDFTGSGDLGDVGCSLVTLLPGQFADCTAEYLVTQADIDAGSLENTAHAEASAPLADDPTLSEDSTLVIPFVGPMAMTLEKSGAGVDVDRDGIVTAGDEIAWSFTVINTGATTLTELEIDDPTAGEVTCEASILPPGASIDCTAPQYRISAADAAAGRVVNVATATALGAGAVLVTSAEATATVEVAPQPLAFTGAGSLWIAIPGLLALLLGAAAIWFVRARRLRM